MKQLSLQDLEQRWAKIEQAVDRTPGIDPWCSGLDWSLAVARGFAPKGRRLLLESENGAGYALFGYYLDVDRQLFLSGLEPLWGFGSPIIGDIAPLVDELVEYLAAEPGWAALALPGLPTPPSETTLTIMAGLSALGSVHVGEGITRQVADLREGHDHWLTNRSSRFRRNLRRAERLADEHHIEFVNVRHSKDIFDRVVAIEHESWKGHDDSGVTTEEMNRMYRYMVGRLQARGRLHAYIATAPGATTAPDGSRSELASAPGPNSDSDSDSASQNRERRDVGYIVGGLRNRRYRGLQLSYVDGYGELSVGNLLQHHQIKALCQQQLADVYDMGMDIEYKRRWADRAESSAVVVVTRAAAEISHDVSDAKV